MNFKDAYKEVMSGKRMSKPGMNANLADGPVAVKYLAVVIVYYMENNVVIKSEPSFAAAFDEKGGIHRLTEQNIIQMFMTPDEDWAEYVEPVSSPADVIEDAIVEPVLVSE